MVSSYSLLFENKNEELLTATSNLLRTRNLGNSWKNEFICLGILGNFNLKANPITQLDYIYTENINPPYLKPFLKYYQSQSNDLKALELLNLAYNLGQITQSEFQLEISILKK